MKERRKYERRQCEYCLYLMIATCFFIGLSYLTPLVDREIMRDIVGTITAIASMGGIGICIYAGHKLSNGISNLSRRLFSVYVMTGLVFVCTAAMGVAGVVSPSVYVWDIIYNIRALAVILEVLAISRFIYAWIKVGQ